MSNEIGTLIKEARLKKGYTQQALADIVGVGKSAVAKWENGRVSEVKRTNLSKLSAALGLDPFILAGGEIDKPTVEADGLSKDKLDLIAEIKTLPEDKVQILLQLAKSIR